MPRSAMLFFGGLALLGSIALVAARQPPPPSNHDGPDALGDLAGEASSEPATQSAYPVIVRRPDGPPRITLAGVDPQGRTGSVACSTCHNARQANPQNVSASTLDEFHQGMTFDHGKTTCYSCHNPNDTDTLRLADGSPVAYQDVMTLCSQCHGPQATAFAHGAHGGMNGHWDLSRGPQTKNNCIDCHDPHSPKYPRMVVGFKPRDRFNAPTTTDHNEGGPHADH